MFFLTGKYLPLRIAYNNLITQPVFICPKSTMLTTTFPLLTLNNVNTNSYPANIYLFKVNKRNSRKRCEICSKLSIKTAERR